MMKQPIEADYEVIPKGGAIEVHFRPTDSYFLFTRLVDAKDVERFGPLSPDVKVRHANRTGDLDDYSAESRQSVRDGATRGSEIRGGKTTMKWEYHFLAISTGQPQVESSVNDLGKESWELVMSYVNPAGAVYFVFKRPMK